MIRFLPENPNESSRARLGICTGIQVSNAIDGWCLVHRCHHKYQDSTSDPHDPRRGFLYSHIGWLLQTRHPDSIKALQEVRSQFLTLTLTSVRACVQIFADLSNQGSVDSREEGYVQRCAGTVLFKFRSVFAHYVASQIR